MVWVKIQNHANLKYFNEDRERERDSLNETFSACYMPDAVTPQWANVDCIFVFGFHSRRGEITYLT